MTASLGAQCKLEEEKLAEGEDLLWQQIFVCSQNLVENTVYKILNGNIFYLKKYNTVMTVLKYLSLP